MICYIFLKDLLSSQHAQEINCCQHHIRHKLKLANIEHDRFTIESAAVDSPN